VEVAIQAISKRLSVDYISNEQVGQNISRPRLGKTAPMSVSVRQTRIRAERGLKFRIRRRFGGGESARTAGQRPAAANCGL